MTKLTITLSLAAICFVSSLFGLVQVPKETIALSGDVVWNDDVQIKSFNHTSAHLGSAGIGVMRVTLKGSATSANDEALVSFSTEGIKKIAQEGDTIKEVAQDVYVDAPGTVFRSFSDFRASGNGDVVFVGRLATVAGLSDPTVANGYRDDGVWYYRYGEGLIVPVTREGDAVLSLNSEKFWNDIVLKPQIGGGAHPEIIYSITLTDPGLYVGGEDALVRWRFDSERHSAGKAQAEPAILWRKTTPAASYNSLSDTAAKEFDAYLLRFHLSSSGEGKLLFQTASHSTPSGIYLMASSGPWSATLQYGQMAPGLTDKMFKTTPSPEIRVGGFSFVAKIGVTDGVGLFHGQMDGSNIRLLLAEKSVAPGLAPATIDTIGQMAINSLGQSLIWTKLFGAGIFPGINDEALWQFDGQETTLLAQTGSVAKAPSMGASLKTFGSAFFLNSSGDYAYQAGLSGDAITASNNEAIYCGRGKSGVKIVQKGDELVPEKKVTALRLLGIDEQRNVFFHASWSGGEGLFYAPSVAVPQPEEGVGLTESWITKEEWGAFVWSPWMDWVWVPGGGWIYTFRHGWMFMMDGYFFSLNRRTWLWTNSAYYPYWVEYLSDGSAVFIQNP